MLLKLEVLRQKRPMAELIREAVRAYVARTPGTLRPGAGTLPCMPFNSHGGSGPAS